MSRTRASAKAAGTRFETSIASYLATHVDDRIERRRLTGARDRGDLSGWRFAGMRIVAELKDHARLSVGPWLNEVEIERGNDSGDVGLVIAKRHGISNPGDQIVLITLRDLVALTTGTRPQEKT